MLVKKALSNFDSGPIGQHCASEQVLRGVVCAPAVSRPLLAELLFSHQSSVWVSFSSFFLQNFVIGKN